MIRVGINGFGRIGRNVLRAIYERNDYDVEVCQVNDLGDIHSNIHLLKYDSTHGRFNKDVFALPEGGFRIQDKNYPVANSNHLNIEYYSKRNPNLVPWSCDVLIECTGAFTDGDRFRNMPWQTIIAQPASNVDKTIVYGINHKTIEDTDRVFSNASCTTNCISWLADIIDETFGLEHGFMNTVHAYTNDQVIVDSHHKDKYRARSGANNIIPTKTGAAETVAKILPHLEGKLTGFATRVPVQNVSMLDFTFRTERPTTKAEIRDNLRLREVQCPEFFGLSEEPLVSSDYNHDTRSCIVDWNQTQFLDSRTFRLVAWYDNEWAFANRLIDLVRHVGKR